ncbi:hypothetical protein CORC01_08725 [Colletotrichum orchidophilum]|uniref:DUF924 domain-containing protein n=1 Tax=Colletotrichum orchidophilum TaxID=1209926 RepID=A0A1G4B426_9PEZI|nr:uncharacterized protein CORC01_08725 [Colletotrichum orchidophilum]OHE96032.1 hypothetical protein CORC01_08725 [Colletotrichum orchidophilum]
MASLASSLPRALLTPSLYANVHNIWFQGVAPNSKIASREVMTRWFGQGSPEDRRAFDETCSKEFAAALESIGPDNFPLPPALNFHEESAAAASIAAPLMKNINNTTDDETKSSQALALVLLLDQIPRNIFRTRQAVIYTHYDRLARAVLRNIMSSDPRLDMHSSLRLAPARRMWFYMPLMHSEYIEDHETYIKVVSEMQAEFRQHGDKQSEDYVGWSLDSEKKHKHLIERFGRYPYRNAQLGRTLTKEEEEYLQSGGEDFGTAA